MKLDVVSIKRIERIKRIKRFAPLIALALFGAALFSLHRELSEHSLSDFTAAIDAIPSRRILAAALATIAGYGTLIGYDALAVRYVGLDIPLRKVAPASFIAYAVSNSVGYAMLSGGSIRYRYYSALGATARDCARIIAFTSATFWLGFLLIGGAILTVDPPQAFAFPGVGIALLSAGGAYVAWCIYGRHTLRIGSFELIPPSLPIVAGQIVLSVSDAIFAALAMRFLLPAGAHLSFVHLLGAYVVASSLSVMSHVPGGLGVLEASMLAALSPAIAEPQIIGSLLVFRLVYDVAPLICAALWLGLHEIRGVAGALVPRIASALAYLGGAILLISGATPSTPWRLDLLERWLPLHLVEGSHFLASLCGAVLLILARGLAKRLDSAWALAVILSFVGALATLVKGLDYEEAIALAGIALVLLSSRSHFHRRGSLLHQRFEPRWIAAIAVMIGASTWLGFFAYRHVEYSQDLWWRFALDADAPRFLRATVGVLTVTSLFALARLLAAGRPRVKLPGPRDVECARRIIERSPRTEAHLALLRDKLLLFDDLEQGFVMYGVEGRSWVAMGDPVGAKAVATELAWRSRELSDRHAGWTVFYEASEERLATYIDLGLSLEKLGEEARVDLSRFSISGQAKKGLRSAVGKLDRAGYTLEIVRPPIAPELLRELRSISDAWLDEKSMREKGFSLGFFDEQYLTAGPLAVVRNDRDGADGGVQAFANLWEGAGKEELSIDLMRHLPSAPHGMMDFLFARLFEHGQREGYAWFNLGMAPLSGLDGRPLAPLMRKIGSVIYRHGEHFYNFRGLRAYKQKFDPIWKPKYLASPGGLVLPLVLANVAALVSRGLKGRVLR